MRVVTQAINRVIERFGYYLASPGETVVRHARIDGTICVGTGPAHITNNAQIPRHQQEQVAA